MSRDDLDAAVELPRPPARVVSLVPSLTEAIATSCPQLLVGATDWCTHPADLDVARVRGFLERRMVNDGEVPAARPGERTTDSEGG